MSKYKYEFNAEMSVNIHATYTEELDLVEDYGNDEEELDQMSEKELEDLVKTLWEDWFWEQCNGGWIRSKKVE